MYWVLGGLGGGRNWGSGLYFQMLVLMGLGCWGGSWELFAYALLIFSLLAWGIWGNDASPHPRQYPVGFAVHFLRIIRDLQLHKMQLPEVTPDVPPALPLLCEMPWNANLQDFLAG